MSSPFSTSRNRDVRAPIAAAVLLLAAAWYWREQLLIDGDQADPFNPEPDWTDEVNAALATARRVFVPTPAADMQTSPAGLAMLHARESLSLTRYRLGDGGWTIGWGRYYPDGGRVPPERIDRVTADLWFAEDVRDRGERWVQAYVDVPLSQPQFDALVSMAFNLKPASFRTIAEAVNAGQDPEDAAMKFIRAGTNLERGLRNRRELELAMYRSGVNQA
jgi:lysozyme